MADWPTVTDDDQTGLTGTIFDKAFFDLIKAFIQAGSHQSGLDANKPAECSPGDVYHATDTEIYYVCFVANTWSGVGGAADPEQVRLPSPEAGDFVTPSGVTASSESGGSILNQTTQDTFGMLCGPGDIRIAQRITLTGKILSYVRFYLMKSGSPTGTLYVRVRRVSDDGIIETSSTTLDVSTLTGAYQWKEFALTCAPSEAVRIAAEYDGGNGSNNVRVGRTSSDLCDGYRSIYPSGGPWNDITGDDITIILWARGTAEETIDDNTATYWVPDPPNEAGAWLKLNLGSVKYTGGCRIYWGSEVAYRPTEYKIYTSPDDSTWTEVIHETEAPPASAWKEYEWYVQKAQYIKIVVTTHGASGTKVYEVDEYSTNQDDVILTHGHGGLS